jgi:hypothetical protein
MPRVTTRPPRSSNFANPVRILFGCHQPAPGGAGAFDCGRPASNFGFLAFLHVLPIPARAVEGWMDLLRRQPVTGADVFDLQLAATMLANGVSRIYTFNGADFAVFPELTVLQP